MIFKKHIITVLLSMVSIYAVAAESFLPVDPKIEMGTSKVVGRILNYTFSQDDKDVVLYVQHIVTGVTEKMRTTIEKDGSFVFNVPVECSVGYGALQIYNTTILVELTQGMETKIGMKTEDNILNDVYSGTFLGLKFSELTNIWTALENAHKSDSAIFKDLDILLVGTPEAFAHYKTVDQLQRKLQIFYSYEDSMISPKAKLWISKEYTVAFLNDNLFDYAHKMLLYNSIVHHDSIPDFVPQSITPSYYSFLKTFDLNSPQNLSLHSYNLLLQSILSDKTLNLPAIGEMSIQNWQLQIKEILSPLVGFRDGLFYDLLTTNAYCRQFENELRPFSKAQIENIKTYYHNGEIAKILLARNEEIEMQASEKPPLVINKTPDVPKEKILDAIVAKYRGKVVYIDLWATWCGPCLDAIQESRGVKAKMKDKNVVFVYLTNDSSPSPLWDEKIKGIGGEHYRLTAEQWEYLMDQSGFEAIPSYLYFDKEGKLIKKYTGYRGNQEVIETLNRLLQ